ncbi:MAG: hypothetical protein PF508_06645 [Spirochaeta sp.]|jgi:hypothetical protein|nr:hypothetical protein [Spirochaeta sp.]
MSGKRNVERRGPARDISLRVDGRDVELNGFVLDVFQETVTALVRTLGTENEDGRIELEIGAAPPEEAT